MSDQRAGSRPIWLGPWRRMNGRWIRPYRRPWFPVPVAGTAHGVVTVYFVGWITGWKEGPNV